MLYENLYFSGLFLAPAESKHIIVGGFYDAQLNFHWSSSLLRSNVEFQGPLEEPDFKLPTVIIDGECYYGGMLIAHFGHFLLESLSRLSSIPRDDKPIYFSVRPNTGVNRLSDLGHNILRILESAVGSLSRVKLIFFACEFTSIHIPKSGYVIRNKITENHVDAMRSWGEVFKESTKYQRVSRLYRDKKIWLSRSSLSNNKIEGEDEFEDYLISNNFMIVKPEKCSIEDQLAIFCNAALVTGFTGTAFHPILLSGSVPGYILHFSRTEDFNQNFETCVSLLKCDYAFEKVFIAQQKEGKVHQALLDLYKVSRVLLEKKYVSNDFRDFHKQVLPKTDFSRELQFAKLISSFESIDEALNAFYIALKMIEE